MSSTESWEARIAAVWAAADSTSELETVRAIDLLVAERPDGDARAIFEAAGARDSAGLEAEAEVRYRRALALGLDEEHRPQAVIQLASTLRNLGRAEEGAAMLRTELAEHPDGPFADAAATFLALCLVTLGRPVDAAALAIRTLSHHLPRYRVSAAAYADELTADRRT